MRRFGGRGGGGSYVSLFVPLLCCNRMGADLCSACVCCVQGIPLTNLHILDALSSGVGVNGAAGFGGELEAVEKEILKAVDAAKGGKSGDGGGGGGAGEGRVLLVLDGLDFLLAATGGTALRMGDVVGEIREVCRSHFHFQFLKTMSLLLLFPSLKLLVRSANTFLVQSACPFSCPNRLRRLLPHAIA